MIIRNGKATYNTDTNTFSFTFPTPEGEDTITLTNGKLRKDNGPDIDMGQLYRYAYFYGKDSSKDARKAFERHIYGLSEASRSDARFLAKYSAEALNKVVPLSDFDAVCSRTYHADCLCRDLADEVATYGNLKFLTGNEQTEPSGKILILDNRSERFGGSPASLELKYKGCTLVMLSPIPKIRETAYCGHKIIGCERYITNPEKLPLAELIGRYAKEHRDGFTIVIPNFGDLDDEVGEIVEQQCINATILPYRPKCITSSEVYEECVYSHVFRHHYEGHEDDALKKLWNSLHYDDLDEDTRQWHIFYEASHVQDDEMREVVGEALAASDEEVFNDCRLINGHDVLLIHDKTFYIYDNAALDAYTPKSMLKIWV